ncbi:MAG: hypothetical protein F4W68_01235 [Cenarchaeum sp. SB0661_bin_35]|nr:hypothetical protein [Cenarchaeum sp. SB0667_bin_13]MXY38158.1 hypothetical protein [Cenarchaeum sp. SB0664_bin_35]MYC79116.1 hypothetical protein [Cenarchaeum sp. SB0661_bin_35]MYI51796.1 hypothetical protein [Cenarchaeum sp. SB0673_bin_9]
MRKTMFVIIMATVIIGGLLMGQSSLVYAQSGMEQIPDLSTLRQESLSNGKIFDRYLIPYTMSQASIEYFGGVEQANARYIHLNSLLDDSKYNKYMEKSNHLTMLSSNFRTLTNTTEPAFNVAALVIHERMQDGTYQQPELEPLKILHEYLVTEYPATGNSSETLTRMFGEMKALTPEVLDIVEKNTLFGNFPSTELFFADMDYWMIVGEYGDCVFVEEGSDCDKYLVEAEALSSQHENDTESSDTAFEKPPTPDPDAYSSIDYHAEVYTRDCQVEGEECTYYKKKSSSTGYVSVTYTGRDHVQGKYVVAYMKTTSTNDVHTQPPSQSRWHM